MGLIARNHELIKLVGKKQSKAGRLQKKHLTEEEHTFQSP